MPTEPLWYELRNAVYLREYELAEKLLTAAPYLLTLGNSLGETVLHFLAVENDIEGVSWLHFKGATLDTKSEFGTPAIFEVAQLGYKELLAWFVQHGANIHAVDADGNDLVTHLNEYDQSEMRNHVRQYGV
jgi:ankyrin repeat protein